MMATQYPLRLKTISCLNSTPPPPPPRYQIPPATPPSPAPPPTPPPPPLLSVAKPSWIVRTESNVRKEQRKKPEPVCVVCKGSGRVDCFNCTGKGRTNYTHLAMLPKGEWPKWCRDCRGSGLSYCSRCLGTGEYRYIMGFRFMNKDCDDDDDQ